MSNTSTEGAAAFVPRARFVTGSSSESERDVNDESESGLVGTGFLPLLLLELKDLFLVFPLA